MTLLAGLGVLTVIATDLSQDFRRHFDGMAAYRAGIDALRAHAHADPAFAWAPGTIQQWAALHQLLADKLDLLQALATTSAELDLYAALAEWHIEVRAVREATAYVLDFSGR